MEESTQKNKKKKIPILIAILIVIGVIISLVAIKNTGSQEEVNYVIVQNQKKIDYSKDGESIDPLDLVSIYRMKEDTKEIKQDDTPTIEEGLEVKTDPASIDTSVLGKITITFTVTDSDNNGQQKELTAVFEVVDADASASSSASPSASADSKTSKDSSEKSSDNKSTSTDTNSSNSTKKSTTSSSSTKSNTTSNKTSTSSSSKSTSKSTSTSTSNKSSNSSTSSNNSFGATTTCKEVDNGHYEQYVTKEAYDEQVIATQAYDETITDQASYDVVVCNTCGAEFNYNDFNSWYAHLDASPNCTGSSHTYTVPAQTHTVHHDATYTTVHHDAEYGTRWVSNIQTVCN